MKTPHAIPSLKLGILLIGISLTGIPTTRAANQTWTGTSGTTGNWSDSNNWANAAAPGLTSGTTSTDIATFNAAVATGTWGGAAGNPVVINSTTQNIGGINFDTNAGAYFIGSTGSNSLLVTGGGAIQILSTFGSANAAVETVNAPLVIEGAGGTYSFANNSALGTLDIGGGVTAASGSATLILSGSNTTANTISGVIGNGAATSLSLTKNGVGTWVLSGTDTYTGSTTINLGTLSLTGSLSSPALIMNGGTLSYAAPGTNAQSFTTTTIAGSVSAINVTVSGDTLNLGALTQTAGSGGWVNFGTTGTITTTTQNTNGILGAWATIGNSGTAGSTATWAANNGSNSIVAYSGYTAISSGANSSPTLSSATVGQNWLTGIPTGNTNGTNYVTTLTTSGTINTLTMQGDVSVANGTTLTLGGGGIVMNGLSRWITDNGSGAPGTGNVTSGLASGELFVDTPDATATNWRIWPNLVNNGSTALILVKDGPGFVALAGSNTYTGGTIINAGQLADDVGGNTGGTGSITPFGSGGTVTINGGGQLHLGFDVGTHNFSEFDISNPMTVNSGSIFEDDGFQHLKGALTINGTTALGSTYNGATDALLNGFAKGLFIDGLVSGTGNITLQQSGYNTGNAYDASIVYFTNAGTSSYSGTITVNPFTNNGGYLFLTGNTDLSNATINVNGNNTGGRLGTSTFIFGSGTSANPTSSAFTIGALSGSGSFVLADTLVTSGANNTSGGGAAVTLTVGGNNSSTTYSGVMSGGGGIVKAGTGTMTLSGANTYTRATNVNSGSISVAGGSLGSTAITVASTGTMAFSGASGFTGLLELNSGLITITSGTTTESDNANPNILLGNTASGLAFLTVNSGATFSDIPGTAAFFKIGASASSVGVLNNAGTVNAGTANGIGGDLGASASASGAIYNTGVFTENASGTGPTGNGIYMGNSAGAYGYIYNSGTFTDAGYLGLSRNDTASSVASSAVVDIAGGSLTVTNAANLALNTDANYSNQGTAQINVTSGTFTAGSITAGIIEVNNITNAYASINVTGSGSVFATTGTSGFNLNQTSASTNIATLSVANGGMLKTSFIQNTGSAASTGILSFNGGALVATGTNATGLIQSGVTAFVEPGGGTINNGGFGVTVGAPLLTVSGSGLTSITLGGTLTGYVGAPVVVISGGGGAGASAIANFNPSTGAITGITITSPGSGYSSIPTITLVGGDGIAGDGSAVGTATATGSIGAIADGGMTFTGAGTTTLSGVSTYIGGTTISNGTVALGVNNALTSTGAININGGTLNLATFTDTVGAVTVTSGAISGATGVLTATSYNVQSGLDSGILGGAGVALAKTLSSGTFTISAADTYTGVTSVNAGTLKLAGGALLGTSAVNVAAGAALAFSGSTGNTITNLVTVGDTSSASTQGVIDLTQDLSPTTVVNLPGGLTIGGTAAGLATQLDFNLAASGSAADLINLGSGVLTGNPGGGVINIGTLALNSAIYTLIDYGSVIGLTPNVNLTVGTHPSQLFTTFTLTLTSTTGPGMLELTVSGTPIPNLAYWTGATTTGSSGAVYHWGDNNGVNTTNWAINSAGTTDADQLVGGNTDVVFAADNATSASLNTYLETNYAINSLTIRGSATDPTSSTSVVIGGTGSLTISALASGSNSLGYAAGTGVLVNSGARGLTINTTGGVVIANNQTWTNNSSNALNVASGVTSSLTSGTSALTLSGTGSGAITLSGVISDGPSSPVTLVISDSGGGIVTLSGSNTFSAGATLNAGTLDINNATALGAGAFTINGGAIDNGSGSPLTIANNNPQNWNASFTFVGSNSLNLGTGAVTLGASPTVTVTSGTLTEGGVISGAGNGLAINGGGTVVLSAAETYTGPTNISGITLNLTGTLGAGTNGGTAITSAGTFNEVSTNAITGTSSLTVNSGVTTLSASNSYTGTNTINGGQVIIGTNVALGGTATAVVLNGGALTVTSTTLFTDTHVFTIGANGGTLNIIGNGVGGSSQFYFNTANSLIGSGTLTVTGNGTLVSTGAGNLRIDTAANSYSGSMVLQSGGIFEYGVAGAVGAGATFILNGAGELATNTGLTNPNAVIVTPNGGTISFNNGGTAVVSGNITLNGTATIALRDWYNYAAENNGTISGVISGNGGLTTNIGTGTGGILFLTNTNTYTGTTTISAGSSIELGNASAAGSLSPSSSIVDNGTLIANRSNAITQGTDFSNGITGTGGITQSGAGVLTLSSSNGFTGLLAFSANSLGKVVLADPNALAGTTDVNFAATTGNTIDFATNGANSAVPVEANTGFTATIISDLATSGSGINHTTGAFLLGGGTLNIQAGANVTSGTAAITIPTASLTAGSAQTTLFNPTTATLSLGTVTIGLNNFTKVLDLDGTIAGNSVTGAISNGLGTVAVTKTNSSTWTLSGANTYTGATTVSGGTLSISGTMTGAGAIAVGTSGSSANGLLQVLPGASIGIASSANVTIGNGITNSTGQGFVYQSGGSFTGIGQLQVGAGLSGSSYGYYSLSSGTLGMVEMDLGGFNGAANGVLDMSGGTLNIASWLVPARGTSGIGILNMTGGQLNFNGPVGQFAVNWNGGTGASVINIANATLDAPNADINLMQTGATGKLSEINLLSGGLLQANEISPGSATGASLLNFNGGTLKASTATSTFLTSNLTAVTIYSGGGTIDNNGVAITIPISLVDASGSGVNTVALSNAGSGYLGAPAVTFTGGGGTGAAGYAVVTGGTISSVVITDPGTGYTGVPTITFTGGGGTGAVASDTVGLNSAGGPMTFQGIGSTLLSGSNSFAGGTIIKSGTVQINTAASLGATSGLATIDNGATVEAVAAIQTSRNFALTGTGGFKVDSGVYEIDGSIGDGANPGTLVASGNGTLDLTASNSYSGGTVINSGDVQISSINSLGAISSGVTINSGTLEALNAIQTSRNFTLSGNATILADTGTNEIDGAITDGTASGTLIKGGNGALDLTGNNSYSGGTVINTGTLQFSSDANLGNGGSVTINNGTKLTLLAGNTASTSRNLYLSGTATIQVDQGSTYSLSGQIGDGATPGYLVKSGSGTLSLGNIGNSGTITVNRGALLISGQANGQAGPLTVNSGGTLGGGGEVQGSVNIAQGGAIAPGYGVPFSVGTELTIDDNLTLSGTANVSINMDNVGDSDLLSVGALTIDPTDTLTLTVLGTITGSVTYDIANFVTESGSFGNIVVNNGTLQSINYEDYGDSAITVTLGAAAVPEPGTWGLIFGGVGILTWWQRKRRLNS